MDAVLKEFALAIEEAGPRLNAIGEEESLAVPGRGSWSRKEILGHLIDSASNNHPRFVCGQIEPGYGGPGYDPDAWVATQRYQEEPWTEIVQLWIWYNRHLLHLIASARPEALAHSLTIGSDAPVTLAFVMEDYVHHMKHHLAEIFGEQ